MSAAMEESRKKKRKKIEEEEVVEKSSSSDEAVDEKKSKKSKKVKKAKTKEEDKKKDKKDKKEKKSKKDKKKDKKDKKDKKKKKTKKKREPSSDEGDSNGTEEKQAARAKKRRKREADVAQLESEAAATMAEAVAEAAKPDPSATTAAAAAGDSAAAEAGAQQPAVKTYPPPPPGNVTLLLFYQYVRPSWTPSAARNAENYARDSLTHHGCTGRLRCAREGFNGTLTGSAEGIRGFCQDLRDYDHEKFGATDFKIVDGLRDNQRLKGLKVWHVEELVTYGFGAATATRGVAPLEAGGTHLPPEEWHAKAAEPDTVLIDVRNANENAIGRFQPLGDASRVLDPNMRTSTEFPAWVDEAFPKLQAAKQVLMYCTGGIRCERASALLVQKGLDASKVFQLEGGIHRYLEAFPTGGHWIGKNYTFDRRFAHGPVDAPPEAQVPVGRCCLCTAPWERYQAHKKCVVCRMEVLLCRECERSGKYKGQTLKCHLCGGPKPSYLPDDDAATTTFKPKNRGHRSFEAEGDY